jgi:DNA-binding transcriptional ArsR family regulator
MPPDPAWQAVGVAVQLQIGVLTFPIISIIIKFEIHRNRNEKMKEPRQEPILMLKALADESRLTLLRVLSQGEQTVGDLARQVDLGEPTVSHHLSKLREAGLVTLRMAGNQRFYRVDERGLAHFKKMVAEIEQIPPNLVRASSDDAWIATLGWDATDQQVLREHTLDGQLTHLPAKQKKMHVILRWLATLFEVDRLYSELEVNVLLKAVYAEDYVSLRRDLVDTGFLRRERGGGKYWLAATAG